MVGSLCETLLNLKINFLFSSIFSIEYSEHVSSSYYSSSWHKALIFTLQYRGREGETFIQFHLQNICIFFNQVVKFLLFWTEIGDRDFRDTSKQDDLMKQLLEDFRVGLTGV